MRKGLLGMAVGAAAALGAGWAAKRLLGSNDDSTDGNQYEYTPNGGAAASTAPPPRREGLDPVLLEILACPDDKEPVIYQKEGGAERLTCTKCGKRYPVRDGIPVMLIDEAQPGPVPTQQEVDAAKALISQGKPAIVGAASIASNASGTNGSAASTNETSGIGAAPSNPTAPGSAS